MRAIKVDKNIYKHDFRLGNQINHKNVRQDLVGNNHTYVEWKPWEDVINEDKEIKRFKSNYNKQLKQTNKKQKWKNTDLFSSNATKDPLMNYVFTCPDFIEKNDFTNSKIYFDNLFEKLENTKGFNISSAVIHHDEAGQPHLHVNATIMGIIDPNKSNLKNNIINKENLYENNKHIVNSSLEEDKEKKTFHFFDLLERETRIETAIEIDLPNIVDIQKDIIERKEKLLSGEEKSSNVPLDFYKIKKEEEKQFKEERERVIKEREEKQRQI